MVPALTALGQAPREIDAMGTSLYPAGLYLSQWLIDQGIREVDGAIIMDPLAVGIKMAKLQHQLAPIGIKRYQAGAWAIPPEDVRKILATEFETK